MRVVLDVVGPKAHCRRKAVGQICKNRGQLVQPGILEDQIVDSVVNDDEHRVVGKDADRIGADQRQPPIADSQFAKECSETYLSGNRADGYPGRRAVATDQSANLGMRFEDFTAPLDMRTVRRRRFRYVHRSIHQTNPRASISPFAPALLVAGSLVRVTGITSCFSYIPRILSTFAPPSSIGRRRDRLSFRIQPASIRSKSQMRFNATLQKAGKERASRWGRHRLRTSPAP